MIADFIKNNERNNFSPEIQEGIRLHRFIDTYTDTHPIISEAKKIFSPLVRLYAGAFIDVAFDYFVAHLYSESELRHRSEKTYKTLWENEINLPENFRKMLIKMEQDDWLTNYRQDWGIEFSMKNVLNKAKYLDKSLPVFQVFMDHKKELKSYFDEFFPQLSDKCRKEFGISKI